MRFTKRQLVKKAESLAAEGIAELEAELNEEKNWSHSLVLEIVRVKRQGPWFLAFGVVVGTTLGVLIVRSGLYEAALWLLSQWSV